MNRRDNDPSRRQRGGTWHGQGRRGQGQWRQPWPPQNDPRRGHGHGYERYGAASDYPSAMERGYGDMDDSYLPPDGEEAGSQHGGYRNTFASDTSGDAQQQEYGYGYGGFSHGGQRGNRPHDEYPHGFAGYGADRMGRLQGPYGTRRDDGPGPAPSFGYGSPSGGRSWGGPHWNDPQHPDYQADYGRRQYARSPTDFMEERYPYPHDYAADAGHYGRGPKGYQRSDQRISEDVCERLSEDAQIDASEIEVSVQAGVVTLKGAVPSRHMKHLAEDCADRVFGVKDVENRVRVERPQDNRDENLRSTSAGAGTFGTTQESRH
jgi:hypothetical protein